MRSQIAFTFLLSLYTIVSYAQPTELNEIPSVYNKNASVSFEKLKEDGVTDSSGLTQLWELAQIAEMQTLNSIESFENLETEANEPDDSFLESVAYASSYQLGSNFYADKVNVVVKNGYTFHVGDYSSDTRIVTCLDGSERGLQAISLNGIVLWSSRNVVWTGTSWTGASFMHFYSNKTVVSAPSSQYYHYR